MSETAPNIIFKTLKEKGAGPEILLQAEGLTPEEVKYWISAIDDSAYTLGEWSESLIQFEVWSKTNSRPLELAHKLEYLSCTAESARGGVQMPLPFLLSEFLKNNGVE